MSDLLCIHKVLAPITFLLDDEFCVNGWCLPSSENLSKFVEYQFGSNKDKLHLLESFYDERFSEIILPELERSSLILSAPYDLMLKETVQTYQLGLFNICIPSLFSIIESMLVFLANDGDTSKVRYIAGLDNTLDHVRDKYDSKLYLQLSNVNKIISELFKKIEFNLINKSTVLNRHESAHGRKVGSYNKADCLKLLVLVSTVKSCYNN
jgi:hypothetical protein